VSGVIFGRGGLREGGGSHAEGEDFLGNVWEELFGGRSSGMSRFLCMITRICVSVMIRDTLVSTQTAFDRLYRA